MPELAERHLRALLADRPAAYDLVVHCHADPLAAGRALLPNMPTPAGRLAVK